MQSQIYACLLANPFTNDSPFHTYTQPSAAPQSVSLPFIAIPDRLLLAPLPNWPFFPAHLPLSYFHNLKCLTPTVTNISSELHLKSTTTSGPLLSDQSTAPYPLTSNTANVWSTSIAPATNLLPEGVKANAIIPFYNGALKLHLTYRVSAFQTNILGLAPNSPVATVILSTGFMSIAVMSSVCLSKKVYVFESTSKMIPRAAALYNTFPLAKK